MSHGNIALFIPHRGCPHQCTFCNQHRITGVRSAPTGEDVKKAVETALSSGKCDPEDTEIAFFGGSFTAVERAYQRELLESAFPYVEKKLVKGIRISTRPDCVDGEILSFLKGYGVTSIELGTQSMDDDVLRQNRRGHTSEDVARASAGIRQSGFSLGLQMMTGLPGDTAEGALETAGKLMALKPDTMRIYPTLVMEDTLLCDQYRRGEYTPMTLEEAVQLCSQLLSLFTENGVRVIRLGLHDSDEVKNRVAGPYHPAFAELCYSHLFLQRLTSYLRRAQVPFGQIAVAVNPRYLSKAIGQGKGNIHALRKLGWDGVFFGDPQVPPGEFLVEKR